MSGKEYKGWIYNIRDHGKIVFLDLRTIEEPYEILQVVAKKDILGEKIEELKKLNREDVIIVKGDLKENEKAPGGRELLLKDYKIIYTSKEPYPLGKEKPSPETEWIFRHLVIRGRKYTKIWYFRHYLMKYLREALENYGYYEVFPPILQPVQCEGGATLFPVKWFDEGEVYLSQSAQLYLEVLIFSLGKVYSLTPSFRAEKSRTRRHLAEYWHLEWEVAFYHNKDMIREEEEFLKYTLEKLLENDKILKILKEFRGEDIKTIKNSVEERWPIVKYKEAIDLLKEKGINIEYGEDLGADEERILTQMFETPIFVTNYPKEIKAFYMQPSEENPKEVENHDLLAPEGYGEVIGGSERAIDLNYLIKRLEEIGEDVSNYEWYLDLRRWGNVYHSGAGLGVDRLLQWILKLDHIKETLPFPRLPRLRDFPELLRKNWK